MHLIAVVMCGVKLVNKPTRLLAFFNLTANY
jgi:hypothetical protein